MTYPRYEVWEDDQGLWRWRYRAANHEIISSGEAYHRRQACEHAVGLMRASHAAPVVALPKSRPALSPATRSAIAVALAKRSNTPPRQPQGLLGGGRNAFSPEADNLLASALRGVLPKS